MLEKENRRTCVVVVVFNVMKYQSNHEATIFYKAASGTTTLFKLL